jgi:hypothetical protein
VRAENPCQVRLSHRSSHFDATSIIVLSGALLAFAGDRDPEAYTAHHATRRRVAVGRGVSSPVRACGTALPWTVAGSRRCGATRRRSRGGGEGRSATGCATPALGVGPHRFRGAMFPADCRADPKVPVPRVLFAVRTGLSPQHFRVVPCPLSSSPSRTSTTAPCVLTPAPRWPGCIASPAAHSDTTAAGSLGLAGVPDPPASGDAGRDGEPGNVQPDPSRAVRPAR